MCYHQIVLMRDKCLLHDNLSQTKSAKRVQFIVKRESWGDPDRIWRFFFQLQHWEFSYKCNRIVCDIASHSNGRPHFLLRDRPHTDIRFNSTFTDIVWSKSIDLLKKHYRSSHQANFFGIRYWILITKNNQGSTYRVSQKVQQSLQAQRAYIKTQ